MAGDIKPNRLLSAQIRNLTLNKIKVILEKPVVEMNLADKEMHDDLLKILAKSVLPRLQEVTGEDGGTLRISFDPVFKKDDITPETTGDSSEQGEI